MSDRIISHFDVSASGLTAERARMRVIASNIANANTTRSPEGGPYKKKFAVLETQPVAQNEIEKGVRMSHVVTDTTAPRMVFDPEHPDADQEGYVAYPNINVLDEVTTMKTATMAYQANLSVLAGTKSMITSAIRIGE